MNEPYVATQIMDDHAITNLHTCDICTPSLPNQSPPGDSCNRASTFCGALPIPDLDATGRIVTCLSCGLIYVNARRSARSVFAHWRVMPGSFYDPESDDVAASRYYMGRHLQRWGLITQGMRVLDAMADRDDRDHRDSPNEEAITNESYDGRSRDGMLVQFDSRSEMIDAESRGDVDAFNRADGLYDMVMITWALEAAVSPNEVMRFATESLKPDGLLVVLTGSRILVPPTKPLGHYRPHMEIDLYPLRFSHNTLTAMMQKHGFIVIECCDYAHDPYLLMVGKKVSRVDIPTPRDNAHDVVQFFSDWSRWRWNGG